MQRLHASVRRFVVSLSKGNRVQKQDAESLAKQFESGHVCSHCESHLLRLPGGEYHWCSTCGVATHGHVSDLCMCGAHVGKHDVQLRCVAVSGWEKQLNPLIRRKVVVGNKPQPVVHAIKLKVSRHELFEEVD